MTPSPLSPLFFTYAGHICTVFAGTGSRYSCTHCPRVGKLSFAHFAQGLNLHELMSSCIGWCCGVVQGIGELLVKPISLRIEPSHCRGLVVYLCPHFVHLVTRVEKSLSQHQQKYWYFSWQQMALPSVSVSFPVLTKNHLKFLQKLFTNKKGFYFLLP